MALIGCSTTERTPPSAAPAPLATQSPEVPCGTLQLPLAEAPAYSGAGPHLMETGVQSESKVVHSDFGYFSLPDEFLAPPREDIQVPDPYQAQLIICRVGLKLLSEEAVGLCGGGDVPNIPVYPAVHTFTIYETRTARPVTTLTIRGDRLAEDSCPYYVTYGPGYRVDVAQGVTKAAFKKRLQSIVFGPVL
ncbi:hypothetical protein ABZS29_24780 [Kribbella sp. NPDC005582]|uniref:hypothetical protein n=1 Tax=Kribbella sp. NPDC005582 TaxID=3156893 RepID=UPI0033A81224